MPRRMLLAACLTAVTVAASLTRPMRAQSAGRSAVEDQAIPSIAVSRQLLEAARLTVGQVITLGPNASGSQSQRFRVVGVYEPMPDPLRLGATRHEVRMHLPDLIEMTAERSGSASAPPDPQHMETVDAINVRAPDSSSGQALAKTLNATLPGVAVRPVGADDQRAAPFIVLERFHLAIAIVTVIASSIFLLALMLMLVDERRDVVGILRLIGYRRRRIVLYVLIEGVVLAVAGAGIGILLAALMQGGINRFFQWRYDTLLVFVRVTPAIALRSIAIAVPFGVTAAMASSWSLLKRQGLLGARR